MFIKCRVCQEKDKRIEDLQKEVKFLHEMLSPTNPSPYQPSLVEQEADKVLSGSHEPIEVLTEAEEKELVEHDNILRERDRMMSGNY